MKKLYRGVIGSTHGEMSRPGSWGSHLKANRGVCVRIVAVQPF